MKLLFVVHRYAPFPGGSEYNVQRLAEEALRQGHSVTVVANEHRGDYNGVHVTSDVSGTIKDTWDCIFIHGSCSTQDIFLWMSDKITSPIYYLLVQPKEHDVIHHGCKNAKIIGCGTTEDWSFVLKHEYHTKAKLFHYGLPLDAIYREEFKKRYGITTKHMFLSVGGFWPHKGMDELADAFREAQLPDTTLVLMGYSNHSTPRQGNGVVCILAADEYDVQGAMAEADLYIMNSKDEGYGLVLLEAMRHKLPWIARDIAAGHDLAANYYGIVYDTYEDLVWLLKNHDINPQRLDDGQTLVETQHLISNSLHDILQYF